MKFKNMKVGTHLIQTIEIVDTKSFSQSPMNLNQHGNIAENPFNQAASMFFNVNIVRAAVCFASKGIRSIDNLQHHDSKPSLH